MHNIHVHVHVVVVRARGGWVVEQARTAVLLALGERHGLPDGIRVHRGRPSAPASLAAWARRLPKGHAVGPTRCEDRRLSSGRCVSGGRFGSGRVWAAATRAVARRQLHCLLRASGGVVERAASDADAQKVAVRIRRRWRWRV